MATQRIRIVQRVSELRPRRRKGQRVIVPELVETDLGVMPVAPYAPGLALLLDEDGERTSMGLPSGLWLDAQVRDGRVQCVGLRSVPGGPEITNDLLRIPLERAMRELVQSRTVRLEQDEAGTIGVLWIGGVTPREQRDADVLSRYQGGRRQRGRPALTDEFLRAVLAVEAQAKAARRPTSREIATEWGVEPVTARGWLLKARKRFESKEETDG